MTHFVDMHRRRFLGSTLVAGGLAAAGPMLSVQAFAGDKAKLSMQLGWIASGNQVGEVVAKRLGYFDQEGIAFSIAAGGPNVDGVAVVASGRSEVGQVSSSPSVMLAVSQGLPIKAFAVGAQRHPFCFFSLAKNPVRKPADLVGKKVGLPATAHILIRALLAQNKVAEKDVTIVPTGTDMTPLLTGQVDVVTGWLTSTTALKVLGKDRVDMALWDGGVKLYALPYYATNETIQQHPQVLAGFLRATARGWSYAEANREKAVDLLVAEYPNLNKQDELAGLDAMLRYSFGELTKTRGWGAMDPAIWKDQIDLYARLGQFTARTPKVEDVMTLDILKATEAARLKG
ncbi:ABC transporter substrate-binding protein [Ramlibacter sp. G-1-2-2]|uniref:Thiamine pyrimidine synthase n=1 Tax=Ramlibacter agri TaxID=2728837 RepID=A0A848GVE7_9BURK|nr:ABC transporter substrate-binding protein [Ramlibacter agri]NML42324.1 ABC transporter substrate-binding protein [Ramlibacter agri]